MSEKSLKLIVIRVGNKYLDPSTTKELRIIIGKVITGDVLLKNKKSDEHN